MPPRLWARAPLRRRGHSHRRRRWMATGHQGHDSGQDEYEAKDSGRRADRSLTQQFGEEGEPENHAPGQVGCIARRQFLWLRGARSAGAQPLIAKASVLGCSSGPTSDGGSTWHAGTQWIAPSVWEQGLAPDSAPVPPSGRPCWSALRQCQRRTPLDALNHLTLPSAMSSSRSPRTHLRETEASTGNDGWYA